MFYGGERLAKMKAWCRYPVRTSLGLTKARKLIVRPLIVNCWPSPSGDGTCDVNIEYELENDALELINLAIAIPLPYVRSLSVLALPSSLFPSHSEGAYPTVASHSGNWAVDPSTHSLLWTVPRVSPSDETRSGSLEFSVGGDDASLFFPVKIGFTALGSLVGIEVAGVSQVDTGEDIVFSQETSLTAEEYTVV